MKPKGNTLLEQIKINIIIIFPSLLLSTDKCKLININVKHQNYYREVSVWKTQKEAHRIG